MGTFKYSHVGPTSPRAASADDNNDSTKAWSKLLIVAPFFHFFVDPLTLVLPQGLISAIVKVSTMWRRFLTKRPFCTPLLSDITVAHVLLCIPLFYWFVAATDLAFKAPTSHHSLKHSGKMTSYAMAFSFLTASKSHSLVSLLTGLSFDRLVNFHLASSLLSLWMGYLHGINIAYYHRGDNKTHHHHDHDDHHHSHDDHDEHHHDENDEDHHSHDDHDSHDHGHHRRLHHDSIHAYLGTDPNISKFFFDGDRNTSGFFVLVALAILVLTSVFHPLFRKCWFEGWLIYHVTSAVIVLIAGMVHGADIFVFCIIWWALDLLIRYGVMVATRYPKQAKVTRVAENITMIQFPKTNNFQFQAGQFVQVAVPSVRLWEFHPFSIASSPDESHITLYVRALPDAKTWTRKLYDLAAPLDENKISTISHRAFLEGPYGSLPPILDDSCAREYSMAVLVSGGIGVTPCYGIAKCLLATPPPSLQKIRYIWSVRDEGMVQAIPPPTLPESGVAGLGGAKTTTSSIENGIELVERGSSNGTDENEENEAVLNGEESNGLDETVSAQRSLALQTDIYITQMDKFVEDGDEETDNAKEAGATETQQPHLPYTIHRDGRPDVHAIMKQVHDEASKQGWGRVFVMGCGPFSLLEELQVACRRSQTKEVQIDFHQEVFDY
ncbi:generating NADPH oxidase heavy chain subunit [Seminavis robusta]|uniref:Generating NADPH oxidase heavy chain subunit n=1 Tax=Seminavis robusta TaxID=568900 RepID=A0A9N8EER1_9STRA|nr:generating NADPH oxidase heavy chain subunit [Seminavis robusta]|eukprot:Sro969_g226170.1 generating NADPH oxidase heavy chain subunit (665) ;mRNA; r:10145-12139